LAAYEDLQQAVEEYNDPVVVGSDPPKATGANPKRGAKPAVGESETQKADNITKAQLAAKEKAIEKANKAIQEKEEKIQGLHEKLDEVAAREKASLDKIIEGAKAEGVCTSYFISVSNTI
jgi:uncharacterized coiled-coil protein SlyX